MIEKLPTLAHLIKQLQHLPYMASKHVYRVAQHFLEMDEHQLQQFCTLLMTTRSQLIKCPTCHSWKEASNPCIFCGDPKRNRHIVCVVETWYDLWALERAASYPGVYHILGGAISPLEGIGPEDLTINQLIARVVQEQCQEVILALNQTPEGEATATFIARKLEKASLKITCLARGIPVGSPLETLDRLTLHKALAERRPF